MNDTHDQHQAHQQPSISAERTQPADALGVPAASAAGPVLRAPLSSARDINIATNLTVNYLGPQIFGPDPRGVR
jgi:hypothetical protein